MFSDTWLLVILHVGVTVYKEPSKYIFRVEDWKSTEQNFSKRRLSTESHGFIPKETKIVLKLITLRKQQLILYMGIDVVYNDI
jgi:hypothetical protein